MIQIEDYDLPIHVAEKIISGTKEITLSPMMKSLRKAVVGESIGDTARQLILTTIERW